MRENRLLRSTWRGLETCLRQPDCGPVRKHWDNHRSLTTARQSSTLPMSGMWKRSHGLAHRAPPTERGGNSDAQTYRHRATSRLYPL
jgi:hypothetical protein